MEIRYVAVAKAGNWQFEDGEHDFTQPLAVDLLVPKLERFKGKPWKRLKDGETYLSPSIACFLSVDIKILGPRTMEVADAREEFEHCSVVSGGRPESNRSKF